MEKASETHNVDVEGRERCVVSNPKLIEAVQAMLQANCRLLFGDDLIVRACVRVSFILTF